MPRKSTQSADDAEGRVTDWSACDQGSQRRGVCAAHPLKPTFPATLPWGPDTVCLMNV